MKKTPPFQLIVQGGNEGAVKALLSGPFGRPVVAFSYKIIARRGLKKKHTHKAAVE